MKSVFIVQHLHTLPHGEEDVKMIGVYKSLEAAMAAVDKLKVQLGFRDNPRVVNPEIDDDPDGFYIDEYQLDTDHWEEGFITQ